MGKGRLTATPAGVCDAKRGRVNDWSSCAASFKSTKAPTPWKMMDMLALLKSSKSVRSSKKSPMSSGRNVTASTEPNVRQSTHSSVNGTLTFRRGSRLAL